MRRATWPVLIAACVGCAKKESPPPVPDVELTTDGTGPRVPVVTPRTPTFVLAYGKLWDPKGAEKADPAAAIEAMVAQQHFVGHQTEFLAPATVGTLALLVQGTPHGVVGPAALAVAYPDAARAFEAKWKDGIRITANAPGRALIDVSRTGTGAASTRVLVFPVPGGTDDELRARFDEYLKRAEEAVKETGATITAHERGDPRPTGPLSDLRYRAGDHTGYVRSAVVRAYDGKDAELMRLMLGDTEKGFGTEMVPKLMTPKQGPFLVVALRDERR